MKYIVLYSSRTGNTKKIAQAMTEVLPEGTPCLLMKEAPVDLSNYDCVCMGFWADKGTANNEAQKYLSRLQNDTVVLFATLGVPPQMPHALKTMAAARALLPKGQEPVGEFHCQGKVDPAVIEMMYKIFPKGHAHGQSAERDALHQMAATHPDANDLANAKAFMLAVRGKLEIRDTEQF